MGCWVEYFSKLLATLSRTFIGLKLSAMYILSHDGFMGSFRVHRITQEGFVHTIVV